MVLPILTHAAETRADIEILKATELKILTRTLNLTLLEIEENGDIRRRSDVQEISDWIWRRREECYAHVGDDREPGAY